MKRVVGGIGSVAGTTAGAAIGQVLIPVPIVGGVVGGVVGGLLGRYLVDAALSSPVFVPPRLEIEPTGKTKKLPLTLWVLELQLLNDRTETLFLCQFSH